MKYNESIDNIIYEHENKMLNLYRNKVNEYADAIKKYNCTFEVTCDWMNFLNDRHSNKRLPFKNGYQCIISCGITRNNALVCIDSSDGEADYYELFESWIITNISRCFFHLEVDLCTDMSDVEDDISMLINMLRTSESSKK